MWKNKGRKGKRENDAFSDLTGSVWTQHQWEAVQAERLASFSVVNQGAKLHYLQQHDNPFNT